MSKYGEPMGEGSSRSSRIGKQEGKTRQAENRRNKETHRGIKEAVERERERKTVLMCIIIWAMVGGRPLPPRGIF